MQRLISFLFALVVLVVAATPLYAAFHVGQVIKTDSLSVCINKADAIAVVEADAAGGLPAAQMKWVEFDRCQAVSVKGPQVGNVVHTTKVKRGEKEHTVRVVEIVNDGEVLAFFFTTEEVHTKDQNNS